MYLSGYREFGNCPGQDFRFRYRTYRKIANFLKNLSLSYLTPVHSSPFTIHH